MLKTMMFALAKWYRVWKKIREERKIRARTFSILKDIYYWRSTLDPTLFIYNIVTKLNYIKRYIATETDHSDSMKRAIIIHAKDQRNYFSYTTFAVHSYYSRFHWRDVTCKYIYCLSQYKKKRIYKTKLS